MCVTATTPVDRAQSVTAELSEEETACLAHIRSEYFGRSAEESWACWTDNEVNQVTVGTGSRPLLFPPPSFRPPQQAARASRRGRLLACCSTGMR